MSGEDGEGGDVPITGPQTGLAGDVDTDDPEDERLWPVPRPSQKSASEGSPGVKLDICKLAAEKCIQCVKPVKYWNMLGFKVCSVSMAAWLMVIGICIHRVITAGIRYVLRDHNGVSIKCWAYVLLLS